MGESTAIAVIGTFDSKAEEHRFLESRIKRRGIDVLTINVGTKGPAPTPVSIDLFPEMIEKNKDAHAGRDSAIAMMIREASARVKQLHDEGRLLGLISAGGGTGTHLCTAIMRQLPLGVPKVMVSTVASRDMRHIVATKDIVMIHSVADILGVNSILGTILDQAAAAVCAMARSQWQPDHAPQRIGLPFFGFITESAENTREALERLGYEVVAFHANGTGGMAMVELAAEGYFDGILDLATHELADDLKDGYCGGIGPERFAPIPGREIPRLVVPGGLDCAVLEFTRDTVPDIYRDRKIFYYDFRSAIRLDASETRMLADQLSEKLNLAPQTVRVLIPSRGWSEADREGGPLFDPEISRVFVNRLKNQLTDGIEIVEVDCHINDKEFAERAASMMHEMVVRLPVKPVAR
jgi:uncharacterized protein (UPF0261 family)